jgi:hypothetical protein
MKRRTSVQVHVFFKCVLQYVFENEIERFRNMSARMVYVILQTLYRLLQLLSEEPVVQMVMYL